MECKMKNILVISYKFPPMGGIGTRRWAKFAKYLAKDGYRVHILTINYNKIDNVNWLHDVEDNENIIIHRVNSGYPLWLMTLSSNRYLAWFQKVLNVILKRTFFYMDVAQNWAKYMLPEAKKIIKDNGIKNVIVTNPPPSVAYISTYLKIDIPNINLIQDFRDSWNDDIDYNYPKTLKFFWQKEKSVYMEWFVIKHSDIIVNVTQDITDRMVNKFKEHKEKFITIYNGYDKDDIKYLKFNREEKRVNKIKIVYAGGLGLGRIKAIEIILDTLLEIDNSKREQFEINIYSSYDSSRLNSKYEVLVREGIVCFNALVSPKKIFDIINRHDYCLSINSPLYPYAFGTKIFDYMLLNKKIIHFSNGGELSKKLKEFNQIVISYNKNEVRDKFNFLLDKDIKSKVDYSEFSIEHLIKRYEDLLI